MVAQLTVGWSGAGDPSQCQAGDKLLHQGVNVLAPSPSLQGLEFGDKVVAEQLQLTSVLR